jgi:hypothetical protein
MSMATLVGCLARAIRVTDLRLADPPTDKSPD